MSELTWHFGWRAPYLVVDQKIIVIEVSEGSYLDSVREPPIIVL